MNWKCQAHTHQFVDERSLNGLTEFVGEHQDRVDLQKATLLVELRSAAEAKQFQEFLVGSQHTFGIVIKLNWKLTRVSMEELCKSIARARTVDFDIAGLTLETHSQGRVQYATNLFADVIRNSDFRIIVLSHYPRLQERCLFIGQFEVRLSLLSTRHAFNWVGLRSNFNSVRSSLSEKPTAADYAKAATALKSALAKHGLPEVTRIGIHDRSWARVLELEEGAFVDIHSLDMLRPKVAASPRSLRKLT